jgi:hypothetical protein
MWEGAWSDGSKEWTTEAQEELGHSFGSDSVFWIEYEDLLRKYQHFDRTRLFRDPDWRSCQRWIGVEVPWKAQYNEKFHIKLTKDSPLVLVLSQLDNRYFRGLQGQYNFRLHFRLHEQDKPGAEDYIVRSHGNYLMDRSVTIELPDMPAGNYSIFISATGERDQDQRSVEDVVKRECRKRIENEKLAQVGYAYDLAHSKATAHLEQVAKLRKKKDQTRASELRKQDRRKQWEKRHLNRDISKRQAKKNSEKREMQNAAAAEKAKQKAEKAKKKEEEEKAKEEAERRKMEEAKKSEDETKKAESDAGKDQAVQTETSLANEKGEDKSVQTESEKSAENASIDAKSSVESKGDEKSSDEKSTDGKNATEKEETKAEGSDQLAEDKEQEDTSSDSTGSPKDTPKTEDSLVEPSVPAEKQPVPAVDGPPPPQPELAAQHTPQPAYESEAESSDSPIEDWEELYSSDDMARKPRPFPTPTPLPGASEAMYESDDETLPEPWNAICIVGFRVLSKDENLELRVVMEGGELDEGGMGEKGEADLDNAQENAGGARGGEKRNPSTGKDDGFASYPKVVRKGGDEFAEGDESRQPEDKKGDVKTIDEGDDKKLSEDKTDIPKEKKDEAPTSGTDEKLTETKVEPATDKDDADDNFVHLDSGASTPGILTPEPTPSDTSRVISFN